MSALPSRALGRTGLNVSVLGFGGAPLGESHARYPEDQAIGAITTALALGITMFDTSPLYGHGMSEHRFGTALRQVPRDSFVLSTKVGRWTDPRIAEGKPGSVGGFKHKAFFDYSYDGAMKSFEQSLLRLGLNSVDLLFIHDVDVWTHGKDMIEQRFREAMDGAYRALARLREEKVIRGIGIGVNEADMCERFARAGDFDVMMLAGRYTLLEQGALDIFLPTAVEKKIAILIAGAFNSGILATGPRPNALYNYKPAPEDILERVRRIEAVCKRHGVELPRAAMQFPLAHPAVASVVLGAVHPDEVRRNIDQLARPVPSALWAELKAQGLLAAHAPTPA
ncbi:MAG TPA: aldo/keto reductase [Pseudorhodoplanes sp.]|jgi:D-threo-aldose 1-dehydrogenase|nr:aldo/keto reductase [Pseudorhodoplanes sp.]